MSNPPPSLRVYTLAKQLPGILGDVLAADGQLLVELELYANEEARVASERVARELARQERDERASRTRARVRPRRGRRGR